MEIWNQIIQSIGRVHEQDVELKNEIEQIGKKYGKYHTNKFANSIECVQKIIFEENIFNKVPYLRILLNHSELCYTHSINVAILSVFLAEAAGYDKQTISDIAIGALLHDIGNIFIPKEIVEKEDSDLNEEELRLKQSHCRLGVLTLNNFNIPLLSQKIIEQHHEKLDGTGYPNSLTKQELPEEAHIVCIAEELDTRTCYGLEGEAKDIIETIQELYDSPDRYLRKYIKILKKIFEV